MQEEWEELKRWLINYKEDKEKNQQHNVKMIDRYCIAISIDDVLDKMIEIEDT